MFGREKLQHRGSVAKTQPACGHDPHQYVLEEALWGLSLEIQPFFLVMPAEKPPIGISKVLLEAMLSN